MFILTICGMVFNQSHHDAIVDKVGFNGIYMRASRRYASYFKDMLSRVQDPLPIVYDSRMEAGSIEFYDSYTGDMVARVESAGIPAVEPREI